MQTQNQTPNGGFYDVGTGTGYAASSGVTDDAGKVAENRVLSNVQERRKTTSDELQNVLSLVLLAAAVKSLVVVGMYWSDVIAKAVTVPQFLITMALTLAVVVAFAGLIAFACMKRQSIEHSNVIQRARRAGIPEDKLLESGVYADPWARQGSLRIALSTALGGCWAASLITYGMYWRNAAVTVTAGTVAHWIAGAAFIVAAAIGIASIVVLALGRSQELCSPTTQNSATTDQPLQASDSGARIVDVAEYSNRKPRIPEVIAANDDITPASDLDETVAQPQMALQLATCGVARAETQEDGWCPDVVPSR